MFNLMGLVIDIDFLSYKLLFISNVFIYIGVENTNYLYRDGRGTK